jgi:DNA polymerase-4
MLELARPLSVGMVFYGLVPEAQHTPSLFDAPLVKDRASKAQLMRSMDALNARYGKNTLYYAASHGALDRAPMRIAFTRIPDVQTEL